MDKALSIVGHAIDHDRNAPGSIAFIADFLDAIGVLIARCPLDGPLDGVLGDVTGKRLVHRQAQTGIGCRIAASHAGGDADFPDQLGEQLTAFCILCTFAVLDIRPLTVPGHVVARSKLAVHSSMASCFQWGHTFNGVRLD